MFETILLPLDGTPQAAAALPLARTMAQVSGGRIVLMRVATAPDERADAERYLAGVASELGGSDLAIATEVCGGIDVATQILWAVRDQHADLVVMATHGRSGIQRAVMGSVAESVMTDSHVPVLLVRPGGKRTTSLRTLLVPVDGTPGGALALVNAIDIARASGARIVLLEIAVPIPLWMFTAQAGSSAAIPVDPSWDDEALASAQTYVDGLATRLRDIGLQVEGRAEVGEVVPTINTVAEEIDANLIVIATHARVGAARAVLGSTADAVVRTSNRPVLLVRRQAGSEREASAAGVLATTF